MSPATRTGLFLLAAAGIAVMLYMALTGLPSFGHYPGPYGIVVNEITVDERKATNVPTAVMFDIRGLDTLGEEYILFTSVAGLTVLLRPKKEIPTHEPEEPVDGRPLVPRSDVVAWLGRGLVGLTLLYGTYVVLHGNLTPGGGFHGGVIFATGYLLLYLARGYERFHEKAKKPAFEAFESIGASAYALIGIATLVMSGVFLENILPLGKKGDITSSGTIALINFCVGVEVAAAFVLVISEMLKETRKAVPREAP